MLIFSGVHLGVRSQIRPRILFVFSNYESLGGNQDKFFSFSKILSNFPIYNPS
jgi:hypothetical protein